MKHIKLLTTITFLLCAFTYAQESEPERKLDSGTIENQFDYIIEKSNRYQDYKVVKRTWLDRLKRVVDDSLNVVKKELIETKKVLSEKESKIITLTNSLDTTNQNVTNLNNQKDSMSFFGMLISKPLYNTILWSIIGVLMAALVIYILRFSRSNSITNESNSKFTLLEEEYEGHRQRSLEREQQLRRKLQDEINKQKKD